MPDQVKIYCADPGAYHDKRGRTWVDTLERADDGVWHSRPPERRRGDDSWFLESHHHGTEVAITSDGPISMRQAYGPNGRDGRSSSFPVEADTGRYADEYSADRWSYTLRCGCGLNVPARGERLWPVLEQLHAGGMCEVSLRQLARVLA